MRKTTGLGLGGRFLNRQGRKVRQGGIVFCKLFPAGGKDIVAQTSCGVCSCGLSPSVRLFRKIGNDFAKWILIIAPINSNLLSLTPYLDLASCSSI
jgi:hypothetical protein